MLTLQQLYFTTRFLLILYVSGKVKVDKNLKLLKSVELKHFSLKKRYLEFKQKIYPKQFFI